MTWYLISLTQVFKFKIVSDIVYYKFNCERTKKMDFKKGKINSASDKKYEDGWKLQLSRTKILHRKKFRTK